jgi:hypothetical protein
MYHTRREKPEALARARSLTNLTFCKLFQLRSFRAQTARPSG